MFKVQLVDGYHEIYGLGDALSVDEKEAVVDVLLCLMALPRFRA